MINYPVVGGWLAEGPEARCAISAPTLVVWGERDSYLGLLLAEPNAMTYQTFASSASP